MAIKPGQNVRARYQLNLSVAEDEAPLIVIKEGDILVAGDEADEQGFQSFTHLNTQFTNIRLHQDDVI